MTIRYFAPANEQYTTCKTCDFTLGYTAIDTSLVKKYFQPTTIVSNGKLVASTNSYKIKTITCPFCKTEIITWHKQITREEYIIDSNENQCDSCQSIARGDFYCIKEKGHEVPHMSECGYKWSQGSICGVKTTIQDEVLKDMPEGSSPIVNCQLPPNHEGDHYSRILKTKWKTEFTYSWPSKKIQEIDERG